MVRLIMILSTMILTTSVALNLVAESTTTGSHKIVGSRMTGSGCQYLPQSYVQSWERWSVVVVEQQQEQLDDDNQYSLQREPAADPAVSSSTLRLSDDTNDWQLRPCLQFLIKGGMPANVMAGLQVVRTTNPEDTTCRDDRDDSTTATTSTITTRPYLAQQWLDVSALGMMNPQQQQQPQFRYHWYVGPADGTDELVGSSHAAWPALDTLVAEILPQHDELFATGFHIVAVPFDNHGDGNTNNNNDTTDGPGTTLSKLQEVVSQSFSGSSSSSSITSVEDDDDDSSQQLFLTCLATGEADAREVLTLDPTLAEMTLSSILQIPLILR